MVGVQTIPDISKPCLSGPYGVFKTFYLGGDVLGLDDSLWADVGGEVLNYYGLSDSNSAGYPDPLQYNVFASFIGIRQRTPFLVLAFR